MITVGELIEKLQKMNPDAHVYFDCYEARQVFQVQDVYCSGFNEWSPCYILDEAWAEDEPGDSEIYDEAWEPYEEWNDEDYEVAGLLSPDDCDEDNPPRLCYGCKFEHECAGR